MDDKFEKKLKAFLPYIIVIGVVFLFVPALMLVRSQAINYIILIGLLPLTALGCCAHYSIKKENDLLISLVAPLFFLIAALLYGMFRDSVVNTIIYLVAYFLCGYLGLMVGDIVTNRSGGKQKSKPSPDPSRPRPKRVAVEKEHPRHFKTEDPYQDESLDTSTTSEDIDAILSEIHTRRSGE